jgi:hypothetical protein
LAEPKASRLARAAEAIGANFMDTPD